MAKEDMICPYCKSEDWVGSDRKLNGEWFTLTCDCLACGKDFMMNFKFMETEKPEE